MDADLQDPPELASQMVELYQQGFDVVHARRTARRDEGAFKRATAWLFYRLMGLMSANAVEPNVGEFRLMSREVVMTLRGLRERHRLVRGLVAWVGFRQTTLRFERPGRAAGTTKFPFLRMLRLSLDAMASFSTVPLRLATLLGVIALGVGAGSTAYALYVSLVRETVSAGTWLGILNLVFSGFVLVCLGIVGEYVGRIFEEVKERPLYVVRQRTTAPAARSRRGAEAARTAEQEDAELSAYTT
jgi:dolichol-phosphate mannosyltransferase